MDHLDDVGEIIFSLNRVHWRIPNYYNWPQLGYAILSSPRFRFTGRHWKMSVYPNGCHWDTSLGWFGISVFDESFCFGSRAKLKVQLGISGQIEENVVSSRADSEGDGNYYLLRLIRRSVLQSNKHHLVPRGSLHLFFIVEKETADIAVNSMMPEQVEGGKEECENIDPSISMGLSWQTEAEVEKEKEEFKEKHGDSCSGEDIQSEKQTGIVKLKQDLKNILVNEIVSDVILKVHGEEYKAHKCILAARSPVFLAMMTHKTKEKNSGIIDIQDADPKIIPEILNYFYTGSVENLTAENALKMYTFADKYQVDELKESCMLYMLTNISVEGFCDVFCLALRHNEKELKEACIEFFAEKSLDIVSTLKWQTFLSENPIIGNELFIKYMKLSNQR